MEPLASSILLTLETLRGTYGTTNSHRYPGAKSCNALYVYSSSLYSNEPHPQIMIDGEELEAVGRLYLSGKQH